MLVLSVDTSTSMTSVALATKEATLAHLNMWAPKGHMAKLVPAIDTVFELAARRIEDVDSLVVGVGPGSFTGLRIGVSIMRTFAQFLGKPIIGIPSLDGMAHHFTLSETFVCPVVDAKRGDVYSAVYRSERGKLTRLTDFKAVKPDELCRLILLKDYKKVVFVGDGLTAYHSVFSEQLGERAVFAPANLWWPAAIDLISLAWPKMFEGEVDDVFALTPIYARLSQAEETWKAKQGADIESRD